MRTHLLVAALAAAALAGACKNGGTEPILDADIGGTWHLALTLTDSATATKTTCTVSGTATFAQTGGTFTGQLSGATRICTGPGASPATDVSGPITNGLVAVDGIGFTTSALPCNYNGVIAGNTVTGGTNCFFPPAGNSGRRNFFGPLTLTR